MSIFQESNKLGDEAIQSIIEKYAMIAESQEPEGITDRTTTQSSWLDIKPTLLNLGPNRLDDGAKKVTINNRTFKALEGVWYLDSELVGQTVTRDTLYKYMHACGTHTRAKSIQVSSNEDQVQQPRAVTKTKPPGKTCSNASAITYALADELNAKSLFADMHQGRENWTSKDLLAALAIIKKHAQANPDGVLGEIYPIEPADYNRWLLADNDDTYLVGPYLLMKHAQQARALIKMEGDDITMTHGDATIIVVSGFEFKGDGEKFAKGLKKKHRPLRYEYISPQAYLLSEIFHRFYNIKKTGDYLKAVMYTPQDATKAKLIEQPDLCGPDRCDDPSITDIMSSIKDKFNAANMSPSDTDVSIESLARICEDFVEDASMESYIASGLTMSRERMTLYDKVFDEASEQTNMLARANAIKKAGAATSLAQAVNILDSERDHRNINNYMQYAYKNMGSIGGNNTIPAADTILKGARIRSFLDDNLCVDYTHATLVGVAYGHMIEPLQTNGKILKLVDKVAAVNSKYTIEEGNIYAIANDYSSKEHGVIIDDTMTESNVTEKEATSLKRRFGVNVADKQSGDWNKFLKFMEMKCKNVTIVSKFSLRSVVSMETRMKQLLFPGKDKPKPFAHVSMVKFGKLHNCETFLVLSNHPEAPETDEKHFAYDVVNNLMCVSMANKLIAQLATEALPNGILPRDEFNTVWLRLVDSLPSKWPWYQAVYGDLVTYGSAITSSVDQYDIFEELTEATDSWKDKKTQVHPDKPHVTPQKDTSLKKKEGKK